MARPNVLREAQLATVELPLRSMRAGFASWLLLRMFTRWPAALHTELTLLLIFALLGLRLAGVLLRRHLRTGMTLAVGVVVLGAAPGLTALALDRRAPYLLTYVAIVTLGLLVGGKRCGRAFRDLRLADERSTLQRPRD